METLTEPKALYDASRSSVQRQTRGSRLLEMALLGSVPLTILLAARNSPLCVATTFFALISPLGLFLRSRLRQASFDPLEIYEGTLVPGPDSATAVRVQVSYQPGNVVDALERGRTPTSTRTYWVVMDVKKAYRIEKTGEISEFTPASPRQTFQIFPRLRGEIGKTLLPDQNEVFAVAPICSWIFPAPVLLGRLRDLEQLP